MNEVMSVIQRLIMWDRSGRQLTFPQRFPANKASPTTNVLRKLKRAFTKEDWLFEQDELNNEIINLRIALNHPGFAKIQPERQCQILTNLGSLLLESRNIHNTEIRNGTRQQGLRTDLLWKIAARKCSCEYLL